MEQTDGRRGGGSAVASAREARERGDHVAEREILERAYAAASGPEADDLRAELALVLVDRREGDEARRLLMECQPAIRGSHPAALLAQARLTWRERGRSRETRAAFEAALAAARGAGDVLRGTKSSIFIAEDEYMEGDPAAAVQRLQAALAETDPPQFGRTRSHLLVVLAEHLMSNHANSAAIAHAEQSLALAREYGLFQVQASALGVIASIHSQSGNLKDAVEAARLACEVAPKSGDPHVVALALNTAAKAHLAAGDAKRALEGFRTCVEYCREHRDDRVLCIGLGGMSRALLASGQTAAAQLHAADALAVARRLGDRESEMNSHGTLASVAEARGDFAAALAAERERHKVEADLRFNRFSERLDRMRDELRHERRQSEDARASETALREALAEVKRLQQRLAAENQYLRAEIATTGGFEDIVGKSEPLRRVFQSIEQVAPTDASVLILGETGVGKELVARAIHARSRRRDQPLVTVNCGALPAALIESELFGHEKGAFTGAVQRKIGRFELADGGTIFLDEIGELPLDLQVRLLRVLQEGEFERVGESVTRKTDVRVVAATNRDLRAAAHDGTFRPDLYYRLAVLTIEVPSLRDRPDDIPVLVSHFATLYQKRIGRRIERIPEETMRAFTSYDWPGNVRELANVVLRAVIVAPGDSLVLDGMFGMSALPRRDAARAPSAAPQPAARAAGATPPAASSPADESIEAADRAHILRVLDECGWNIKGANNAAERLGVPPSTLRSRMARLGISRESRG